jgi:hypothetical protein
MAKKLYTNSIEHTKEKRRFISDSNKWFFRLFFTAGKALKTKKTGVSTGQKSGV